MNKDHNSVEYHLILLKAHSKANATRPPFCFFTSPPLSLFVATRLHWCWSVFAIYVTVRVTRTGSVCGISNDCGIPNYATFTYLASRCGNERVKQNNRLKKQQEQQQGGVFKGWGHKVGWRGLGAGWRGTDGSRGSGLFWANSWKQTHITHMLLCSRVCSDFDF